MSEPTTLPSEARDRERGLLLSDRFNPLFVRDLQQTFAGKGFVAALFVALLAMLVVASVALNGSGDDRGPRALGIVLFALGIMVNVVVPLQAFQATRQEMQGGTCDQLLLSSLSPAAIVRGKLLAAALKIAVWVSLFAPLVALTWLLRGLSVAQVVMALFLAMLSGMCVSAVAVVLGTLTVFRRVASLVQVAAALLLAGGGIAVASALAAASFAWLAFGGAADVLTVLGTVLVSVAVLLWLCVLMARSQFTHPHENRSTGFRIFLPVATLLAWGMAVATGARSSLDEALPVTTLIVLPVAAIFFVFASTEDRALSPRVQLQVPAGPGRAMWVALLLPGGGRGLLWSLAMTLLLAFGPELVAAVFSVRLDAELSRAVTLAALYALLYAAAGAVLRRFLPAGTSGRWWARLIVLGLVVLGSAASTLVVVLSGSYDWSLALFINPFWTVAAYADGQADPALALVLLADIGLLVATVGAMGDGVTEVTRASAARRSHAA